MKKVISVFMVFVLVVTFVSCSSPVRKEDTVQITDMLGRRVDVPKTIDKAICIGAGALRLFTYVGELDRLCGVEACEYGFLISERPYQYINEDLFKSLTSVGAGGPQGSADAEAILNCAPDVVFSTYTSDLSAVEELQKAISIPVVVLSYGETEAFDDDILASIELIGAIMGAQQRAAEVTDFIKKIKKDLNDRTNDIADDTKKTVYLACQSNYGTHGIGSSTSDYSLFDAVNAKNVLDINGYKGYYKALDLETLLTLDPQVIIVDAGGLSVLREEYSENKTAISSLQAFKNGEVYLQMPYNAYYTNLEIAYANAFFIGKTLYPERFSDIDVESKFKEICSFMLGEDCYDVIARKMYGGYQKLDIAAVLG